MSGQRQRLARCERQEGVSIRAEELVGAGDKCEGNTLSPSPGTVWPSGHYIPHYTNRPLPPWLIRSLSLTHYAMPRPTTYPLTTPPRGTRG